MYYSYNDTRTDRERQLEWELEEAQRRENETREREQRRYDERMAEVRQRVEDSYRTAATWPEALSNQSLLMRREANFDIGDPEYVDDYFGPGADACDKALEYWHEESEETNEQIAALRKQIEELRAAIALRVADRLEAHEGMPDGWYSIAGALRSVDESDLSSWLYW